MPFMQVLWMSKTNLDQTCMGLEQIHSCVASRQLWRHDVILV